MIKCVCMCVCVSENGHQPSKSRPSYNSRIMIMNHQFFGNLLLFSNIVQYQRIVEIPGVKSTIWIWKIKYFSKYQSSQIFENIWSIKHLGMVKWLGHWKTRGQLLGIPGAALECDKFETWAATLTYLDQQRISNDIKWIWGFPETGGPLNHPF